MIIIRCDYHPSCQQTASVDSKTGECGERRMLHSDGEVDKFYRGLKGFAVQVGIEATGHAHWFEPLLSGVEVRAVGMRSGPH